MRPRRGLQPPSSHHPGWRIPAVPALVTLACIACDADTRGSVDESGLKDFLADVPVLDLTEVTSLGAESAEIGPTLSESTDVVLGPDLSVYVADPGTRSVTRYESDFSGFTTFVGEGEGPGEALLLSSMSLHGDSLLVISDRRLGRVSLFSLEGEFLEVISDWTTERIQEGDLAFTPTPAQVLLSDGAALTLPLMAIRMPSDRPAETRFSMIATRHYSGQEPDRILHRWEWVTRRAPEFMRGGVGLAVPQPFAMRVHQTLMKDGSGVVGAYPVSPDDHEERSMEVHLLSEDGEEEFTRRFPANWTAVHDWMLQERLTATADRMRPRAEQDLVEPPTVSELERHVQRAGLLPPYPNPVRDVLGAESGSVWVALEHADPDTAPWVRLDRAGEATGYVILPRNERVVAERDHRLLTVRRDSPGVTEVVVYRGGDLPGVAGPE